MIHRYTLAVSSFRSIEKNPQCTHHNHTNTPEITRPTKRIWEKPVHALIRKNNTRQHNVGMNLTSETSGTSSLLTTPNPGTQSVTTRPGLIFSVLFSRSRRNQGIKARSSQPTTLPQFFIPQLTPVILENHVLPLNVRATRWRPPKTPRESSSIQLRPWQRPGDYWLVPTFRRKLSFQDLSVWCATISQPSSHRRELSGIPYCSFADASISALGVREWER